MENKNKNFLANIFVYLHDVIDSADKPISKVVMVLLPFLAPLLPSLITSHNLQKYMSLDPSWAWIGILSFEGIGYLGMISLVGAIMRYITEDKNTRNWIGMATAGTAYFAYLASLIASNLVLESKNGVASYQVFVTACLTVGLSVSAALLNGQRIYDRVSKENEILDEDRRMSREEQLAEAEHRRQMELEKLKSEERIAKAQVRASKSTSNQLQTNRVFEASTSKSASNPSYEAPKPKTFEAVSEFIEDYLKQNNALPKTQPLMDAFGISQSAAYYAMVKYKFVHSADLVASGLLTQEDADKNALSYEKMPKGKKTQ